MEPGVLGLVDHGAYGGHLVNNVKGGLWELEV
jgi:hypothetical protein